MSQVELDPIHMELKEEEPNEYNNDSKSSDSSSYSEIHIEPLLEEISLSTNTVEQTTKGLLSIIYFYWNNPFLFLKLCALSLPSASQGWMWDKNQYIISYFLGFGMSNNIVSINDIFGPLAGLTIGMVFGSASDTCMSRWGRRRPFLFWSLITSVICHQIISYAPEIGVLLGDTPLTEGHKSSPHAISIMLTFFFLSDFTQNIMQIPEIAIVADFAGEHQASAQMIRIIISALFGRLFSTFAALYNPTTSVEKMHFFFFVVDGGSVLLHAICYIVANEKPLEKLEKSLGYCRSIIKVFQNIYLGVKKMPSKLCLLGICFGFAGFATSVNLKYMQLTGQLTYSGDSNGASTCGDNCTEAQNKFNMGNNKAAEILAGWGWVYFTLIFVLFFFIEPLLKKFGVGRCYAVVCFGLSSMLAIPWVNIWVSGSLQGIITIASQLAWLLPSIAVVQYCYSTGQDRVSFYNSTLNTMANLGQIITGLLNTTLSSFTYLGFGLSYVIAGGLVFFSGFLALRIPKSDEGN